MRERDVIIGCVVGSVLGFWVAQYLSTLPTWPGTPILANCNNLIYCSFIIPFSILAVLIMISIVLWEILMKPKQHERKKTEWLTGMNMHEYVC